MPTKSVTTWVIVAAAAALIVWDIRVAANAIPGDTISELMLAYARAHPWLPFAWGVLSGHLFWPLRGPRPRALAGWRGLLAAGAAVGLVAWLSPPLPPLSAVLLGMPVGRTLWGQEPEA